MGSKNFALEASLILSLVSALSSNSNRLNNFIEDVPWSKDILVVFSGAGAAGFERFLQQYHNGRTANYLPISASFIQWALLLDFSKNAGSSIMGLELDIGIMKCSCHRRTKRTASKSGFCECNHQSV